MSMEKREELSLDEFLTELDKWIKSLSENEIFVFGSNLAGFFHLAVKLVNFPKFPHKKNSGDFSTIF